ncbi:MAG: efflux RND transporter permease subunit [Polyangiales bacterium]
MSILDTLIGWSIRHRVVVLLAALLLAVLGVEQSRHARTDVLPDFTPPYVVVQTEAPGLPTLDVEDIVTRPLERVLLGIPDVTSVRSVSSPGVSVVTLLFAQGIDVYRARQLVTERLPLASTRFPATVKPPQLAPLVAPIAAVLKFCITTDAKDPIAGTRELRTFADWTLRPRLLGINGVSQVFAIGGAVERFEIHPKKGAMATLGVLMTDLRTAIADAQSLDGLGFVALGNARIDVQSGARLHPGDAVERMRQLVVKGSGDTAVRLRDVADVVVAEEPRLGASTYDGKPAVYVQVNKLAGADTVTTSLAVEAALRELEKELPPGAKIQAPVFRQATFVERSLSAVGHAMAIGSALVVVVLLSFLRSPRLAAISLVAIPLSVLGAATALVLAHISIDAMTLGGLALSVGEVVDDAIVDVENVFRRLRVNAALAEPRPALDVVRDASHEIRGSVTYATVVVIMVLLPVATLGGIEGAIFAPLALAYALSIGFSLVVALTVTPAMCAWLLPKLAREGQASPTAFALALVRGYGALLRRAIRIPRLVLGMAVILGILAVIGISQLGGSFLPELHEGSAIAKIDVAPGVSIDETMRIAAKVEVVLRASLGNGIHVAARAGRTEQDEDASPSHRVELDVVFAAPPADPEAAGKQIAHAVETIPGLGVAVEGVFADRIHDLLSGGSAPIVVQVQGDDLQAIRDAAAEVAAIMGKVKGLESIHMEPQVDVAALRVTPDEGAAARHGLRPREIVLDAAAALGGERVFQVLAPAGRAIDVVLVADVSERGLDGIAGAPVTTAKGAVITLGDVAKIARVPSPAILQHEGGLRRIAIEAEASGTALSSASAALRAELAKYTPPKGVRVVTSGEAEARAGAARRLLLVGALVLVAIFLVLTLAFSSMRDAGTVLLNVPLGLVGGVAAAALSPGGLSVAAFVGFVALFGVIARNGIMLVAHHHQLERENPELDPLDRVLLAAEERVIPILMTAATAGLGLLPLAFSVSSGGNELEVPMARIVCAGLASATVLNLVVLPVMLATRARRRS